MFAYHTNHVCSLIPLLLPMHIPVYMTHTNTNIGHNPDREGTPIQGPCALTSIYFSMLVELKACQFHVNNIGLKWLSSPITHFS